MSSWKADSVEQHPLLRASIEEDWPTAPEPMPPSVPPTADGRVPCQVHWEAKDTSAMISKDTSALISAASAAELLLIRKEEASSHPVSRVPSLEEKPWVLQKWIKMTSALLSKQEQFSIRECWEDDQPGASSSILSAYNATAANRRKNLFRLNSRTSAEMPDPDIVRAAWEKPPGAGYQSFDALALQQRSKSENGSWKQQINLFFSNLVLHPYSSKRVAWIMLGLLFMGNDIVQLTMDVFDRPAWYVIKVIEIVANVYWTLDIGTSFITGAFVNSQLDLNHWSIAKRYMKTWFFFDVLLAITQWVFLLLAGIDRQGDNLAEHSGIFRYFRVARYSRLLRFAKLDQFMSSALERLNSVMAVMMFRVSMYLFGLVLWVHVSGMTWFVVGLEEDGWAHQWGLQYEWPVNYLAATHWAASQFQGNYEQLINNSAPERAFAMVHTLLAVVVLAAFVSKLTTVMHTVENIKTTQNRQVSMVRRYCEAHSISVELSLRVRKYVEWKQSVDARSLHDALENELMQVLPIDLRRALLGETRAPLITTHIVFLACRENHMRFFQRLCCDVMTPTTNLPDVNVFCYGMLCTRMYIITAGELAYLKYGAVLRALISSGTDVRQDAKRRSEEQAPQAKAATTGMKFCEAVLWTRWVHLGDLSSITHVNMLAIEIHEFEALVQSYPAVQVSLVHHAQRFVAGLNNRETFDLCDMFSTDRLFDSH